MSGSMAPAGDVTSSGLLAGDDPLHYALLLLIVQVAIIIVLSRFITLLFRPLRQPRVVSGTPSLSRFCWGVCVCVCVCGCVAEQVSEAPQPLKTAKKSRNPLKVPWKRGIPFRLGSL